MTPLYPFKSMATKKKVLMVCLGNSCRSPMAEAIFWNQIKELNLCDFWETDSAALLEYHIGNAPEPRAMATLTSRGITEYTHTARQITKEDFYIFDWIFGMDNRIIYELYQLQPEDSPAKIELLGNYDPIGELNIRDPLFDVGSAGFEKAFEQAARCINAFLEKHKGFARMQS